MTEDFVQPERSRVPKYIFACCGLVTMVVVILAVVGFFFFVPRLPSTLSGAQPGGRITGRIAPSEALVEVRTATLSHATASVGSGYTVDRLESVPIAPDGSFAFDAPALEGFYVVSAEGRSWVEDAESVSLIGSDGTALPSVDVELELDRGCLIEVSITRKTPGASTSGDVRFELENTSGLLFGVLGGGRNGSLGFSGGSFEIGPLPPSKGQLTITMSDGQIITLDVECDVGPYPIHIEL
jgi:hypothetical protein